MAKTPVKREAGQSLDELAAQLSESKQGNKLYSSRKTYGEVSSELKAEALSVAIDQQMKLLDIARERGKVDLNDIVQVRAAAEIYMRSCQLAGTFPTVLALSAALGYSRQYIYAYISSHDTESAKFLDHLRSSFAAIIAEMGLKRQCSEPLAIFLLKNSGQGLADKIELEAATKPVDPFGERMSAEELQKKYLTDVYAGSQE